MKTLLTWCALILISKGYTQSASWNDEYTGNIMGVDCRLQGHLKGSQWTAQINAQGYIYNISGAVSENKLNGTLSDPATNGSLPCAAMITGESLTLTLQDNLETYDLVFTKSTGATLAPPTSTNIDNRLIGHWRYTHSYVSGQFSFATDYHMNLNPDGTMVYQERTAGGGPDVSMDSGDNEPVHMQWKTDNQSIYVNGGQGWEFLARYAEHNGNLMLTYENGSKKVWEKL